MCNKKPISTKIVRKQFYLKNNASVLALLHFFVYIKTK